VAGKSILEKTLKGGIFLDFSFNVHSHLKLHWAGLLQGIESARQGDSHVLINYIDTKAKCCHLKKRSVKGLCGRCLSEFIDL
jgi:hypothetical protein